MEYKIDINGRPFCAWCFQVITPKGHQACSDKWIQSQKAIYPYDTWGAPEPLGWGVSSLEG